MEILNRTELQINQAENDIIEDFAESEKVKLHEESITARDSCTTADNYKKLERKFGKNDDTVTRLRDLITARANLLQTKSDVQKDYITRIIGDEPVALDELQNFEDSLKDLKIFNDSTSDLQNDGKMLYE